MMMGPRMGLLRGLLVLCQVVGKSFIYGAFPNTRLLVASKYKRK